MSPSMSLRLIAVSASFALSACSAPEASSPAPTLLRVAVVPAATRDIAPEIALTGELVPTRMLRVVPEVDGVIVERVLVDVGDRVERGQALVEVDDDGLRLELIQAHAEREQAAAETDSLRRELARIERVVAIGGVSENERDLKRSALRAVEQRTLGASAARDSIARRLNLASPRAPASGRILERNVEAGDRTGTANTPYFVIAADGEAEFEALAGLRQLQPLRSGMDATVRPADGSPPLRGRVRIAADALMSGDRRGKVRIALERDEAEKDLAANGRRSDAARIGTPAIATVTLPARRALVVPAGALRFSPEPWLWVVDAGDRVRRRDLRLGVSLDDGYEVLHGLRAGERLVADAGALLVAGDRIHPLVDEVRAGSSPAKRLPIGKTSDHAQADGMPSDAGNAPGAPVLRADERDGR